MQSVFLYPRGVNLNCRDPSLDPRLPRYCTSSCTCHDEAVTPGSLKSPSFSTFRIPCQTKGGRLDRISLHNWVLQGGDYDGFYDRIFSVYRVPVCR